MHLVLAMEVREGQITQETALCLMVATGHPFEVIMATYHQPSIAGDVAGPSSNTQSSRSISSGGNKVWNFTSRVFISRETHSHCVGSGGPRGSERSRDS